MALRVVCLFRLAATLIAISLANSLTAFAQPADRIAAYRDFALANSGDATAGELLFRTEKSLACANCHRITGAEKSGPNLDGIADKFRRADLIEHILRPSLAIKPGYEQSIVTTKDGRTLVGRISRLQKSNLRVMNAEGREIDVVRENVEEISESPSSLMPDNVAMTISPQQFADLVAYLQTLNSRVTTGFLGADQPVEVPRISQPVRFTMIHPPELKFANPVWCGEFPGAAGQLIVLEHQEAKAWRLVPAPGGMRRELFLDLSGQVKFGGNWGLMCIAFHPQFNTNRRYFLEHEAEEEGIVKTTIVERRASADLLTDSGEPSRRLFALEQPAYNHNGGCLAFGPDGMLYIGFGDGGFQNDPSGNGQNLRTAHSKMLRIDVDRRDSNRPYAIPADNPFLHAQDQDPAALPEIWATGLREPWRYSFDSKTGELWVGDVGQDKFEEVCLLRAGENHGWNVYEGFEPFSNEFRRPDDTFTFPVFAYPHSFGVSVTGGYVYRGRLSPSFDGVYIFGDYETRRVWGLKREGDRVLAVRELGEAPLHIVSFGVDSAGEIYLVGYEGAIFRLDLSESRFE